MIVESEYGEMHLYHIEEICPYQVIIVLDRSMFLTGDSIS